MQIRVTSQDIEHGVVADCQRCPIARAFARLGYDVTVDPSCIIFYGSECDCEEVSLPPIARYFLHRFDCGQPVDPFEFEIDAPAVSRRCENRMSEVAEQFPPSDAAPEILRLPIPSYDEISSEIERLELTIQRLKRDAGLA